MSHTVSNTCAIMQPYFFPYLAYFQLINAVDTHVIYDDVNYIKGGWINRNNILSQAGAQRITLSLSKSSQNRRINEIEVCKDKTKLVKTIVQNYSKAPYFHEVLPILEAIISYADTNLAGYLEFVIRTLSAELGIKSKIIMASSLQHDKRLSGQDRIIAICDELTSAHYVNAIGGRSLYQYECFTERGKRLSFLQTRDVEYEQFRKPFVSNLSIIDVMMFNHREHRRTLLNEYDLISASC